MKKMIEGWFEKRPVIRFIGMLLVSALSVVGIYFVLASVGEGSNLVSALLIFCGAAFLCYRAVKTIRWWKKENPPGARKFFSWFLPVLAIAIMIPCSVHKYHNSVPVPQEDLITVTGQMESIRESMFTHASRTSVTHNYYYSILLKSGQRLYLPSGLVHGRMTNLDDFLKWVGEDTLVCLCDRQGTIYKLTREDGKSLITYEQNADMLQQAAQARLVLRIALILAAAGLLTLLPPWLTEGRTFEERAPRWVFFWVALIGCLLVSFFTALIPDRPDEVKDFPAYTQVESPVDNTVE